MRKSLTYLFMLFELLGFSQEPQAKDTITQLPEVIVMDTLMARESMGTVTSQTIGAQVFQNYSPLDVISAINQLSGVYVLSGALNTNRITIRGVGARTPYGTDKLRLYYNNIPVTNGAGFSGIEAYDLENLTSIEVIKGPKGTAFGTNLGGSLVLNTKKIPNAPVQLTNTTTFGSYGLFKNSLRFTHSDKKVHLSFNYGHTEINGYRENNRFKRDGLLLHALWQLAPNRELEILVNYIDYNAQIASSLGKTAFEENPRQAAYAWKASKGYEANKYTLTGVTYKHTFFPNLTNKTSLFYTYLDHYEPRPFNILDEFTHGFGFRTLFSGKISTRWPSLRYTLGAELYKDEYHWATFGNLYEENNGNGSLQGNMLSKNKEFRSQFNGFGTLAYAFTDKFTAQLGINVNHTKFNFYDLFNLGDANKNAKRDFDPILLPSLDLNYKVTPSHTIFFNMSRGFSNPSLEETLTPDGLINPDIKQEDGVNYEMGLMASDQRKRLNLSIAVYNMRISNLLVAQRVGEDQFIGKNAGKTRHQGMDMDINYTIPLARRVKIIPFVSYTLSNHTFLDFVDHENDYSGNPLTGVPKHRLTGGLQAFFTNGMYWNTTYEYVDRIPLTDASAVYSEPYSLWKTKIGYRSQLSKNMAFTADFGVNNIANVLYAQSVLINAVGFGGSEPRFYYPGNGRNYFASIKLAYSL